MDQAFKGIMFSNLPNLVPLTATYDGPAIERSVIRTFTVVDDGSYFTQGTPTAEWDWEKKVNRIILPANDPLSVTNESEAVNFTIDMGIIIIRLAN